MSKQDRQGVRTARDIEAKYDLSKLKKPQGGGSADIHVQQLTQALNQFMAETNAKFDENKDVFENKADLDEKGKLKSEQIPDEILKEVDLSEAINTALSQAKESGEFNGEKGDAGKTAYQYAKDGGYEGTETDFAEKLAKEQKALTINGTGYDGSEAVSVDTREFVINATIVNEADGSCEVDVTADEFRNAYDSGQTMVMVCNGFRCRLMSIEDTLFVFVATLGGCQTLLCGVQIYEQEIFVFAEYRFGEITIGDQIADGLEPVDFTDTINQMIDEKSKDFETTPFKPSVKSYGAVGDGVADDTEAFQNALAENRLVYVPEGTYIISDTLTIEENCELELSQATHLKFTQTSGNCIELRSSATLRGNHAVIEVPYAFTGNVISADTQYDEGSRDTPPFIHWDPMWKRARYIYDVCIVKPNSVGIHCSINGECSGTGVYLSAKGKHLTEGDINYIWGAMLQGVRIAGAFTYGIQAENIDNPEDSMEDDAWNHDMRIEAVIQGCETGVSLFNCNLAHLSVTIQPSTADGNTAYKGTKYAKWGVRLEDCKGVDMTSSFVWDWQVARNDSAEYTHIAMYGNCTGLVLGDYLYHANSTDIRKQIYTDTPSNLEKMTVLQEPITRWFKPIDGEPYFSNGGLDKKLLTQEEFETIFVTDKVKQFTDVLPEATDGNGNIFNGKGYLESGYYVNNKTGELTKSDYCGCTGFIPVKSGDTVYVYGIKIASTDYYTNFELYNENFEWIIGSTNNKTFMNGTNYYFSYEEIEDGFKVVIAPNKDPVATAYLRFSFNTVKIVDKPVVTVNEEIKYTYEGFLADDIKIKAENVIGLPNGGIDSSKIDETLKISEQGVLGVNTITKTVKDNTLPITSGAVYAEIGNIGALLATI